MSEDKDSELKFIRLRSIPDDLVGYVTFHEEHLTIEMPLRIEIETYFEEGRQILALQEYLPQSVIELKEIEFPYDDVLFTTPIREEFVEQYLQVSEFFYNNKSKFINDSKKKEVQEESVNKVVSILEALASKKDKPVH